MAFLTITIAGVDRSDYLCAPSSGDAAQFEEALRERKRFSLEFLDRAGLWYPARGQGITVEHSDEGMLFGGYIGTATRRKGPGTSAIYAKCTCISYEQIPARRRSIARSWEGQLAGGIFNEVITESLIDEGFTVEFEAGPVIPYFEVLEPRPSVEEVCDRICELASTSDDIYYWDVTPAKVARFFKQDTYPAPFAISDANPYILENLTASVDETNQGLVNSVWVFLGQFLLEEATETQPGNGSRRFEMEHPIGAQPTITVDAGLGPVDQLEVGIDGVDTAKKWYWRPGSTTLRQDDSEPILAEPTLSPADPGHILAVTYRGLEQRVLGPFTDDDSTNAEGVLQGDGTTGIYETFVELDKIGTASDASTLAQAWLDRYKRATITFRGAMYTGGLRVGQELSVSLTKLDIDLVMLIRSVTMNDVGAGRFLWNFEAIYGAARDDWKRALLGRSVSTSISGGGATSGGVIAPPPEGPSEPGDPGAPAVPGDFEIGTLTARWVDSDIEGSSSVEPEIIIPVTPPEPIGATEGGHIYVELQDQSSAPSFRLGSSNVDDGDAAVGTWDLRDMGKFPYVEDEQPWMLRLPGLSIGTRRTTTLRVYVEPYSSQVDAAPIRAGEEGETPSATVTLGPYQAGKPSSGTHVTSALIKSITAEALDLVLVSGQLLRPIAVTVELPDDPPDNWAYQIIGFVEGDIESSPVLATGANNEDVATDPVPAGDDGITTPHTFGNPEPSEIQRIVIYAVAGKIMPAPVPRGHTPGDPTFVPNNIVDGITVSAEITIGTLTGVMDPTEAMREKLNETMGVLEGAFGVKPLGIREPYIDALAVSTEKIKDAAVELAKLHDLSVSTAKVIDAAVGTAKLADLAATLAKLADLSVSTAKVIDQAVSTNKMADLAATAAKLASSSVDSTKIAALAVGTAAIAAAAVVTAKIGNLAVTTALIDNLAVATGKIALLGVTTALIDAAAITTAKIANLAVTTALLDNAVITTAKVANLQITTALIANQAVGTSQIANLAVGTAQIALLAVTDAQIGSLSVAKLTAGTMSISGGGSSGTAALTVQDTGSAYKTQVYAGALALTTNTGAGVMTLLHADGAGAALFVGRVGVGSGIVLGVTISGGNAGAVPTIAISGQQVVTTRQASVTGPTGGAVVDNESRTAINTLISRLQSHGLIS